MFDPLPEALQLHIASVNVVFVLIALDFHQRGYSQLYWIACIGSRSTLAAAERMRDASLTFMAEEFVLLLPNTDAEGCEQVGEKVRGALHEFGAGNG
ncbi:MAG: Diguanylate cyclase [Bradyrhizobium sp.]|nr:Diguanylate cyclase [Bradyrhizobium sp.]MEA2866728.1 hypothetical protein [Bradyrhizobium sp.]